MKEVGCNLCIQSEVRYLETKKKKKKTYWVNKICPPNQNMQIENNQLLTGQAKRGFQWAEPNLALSDTALVGWLHLQLVYKQQV